MSSIDRYRFRVWDERFKAWSIPSSTQGVPRLFVTSTGTFGVSSLASITEETAIVEQWTGLMDAIGCLIFEGDIISFTIKGVTHGPEADHIANAQVWYSTEDARWTFGKYPYIRNGEFHSYWWYSMEDGIDKTTLKVIGDIHSTPELLATHPIIS